MITEIRGSIFDSRAQAIVNLMSCEEHVAPSMNKELRTRYPAMHEKYKDLCRKGIMFPGQIFVYKGGHPIVLNFGVKQGRNDAVENITVEKCLQKFAGNYRQLKINSVAFPIIRSSEGMASDKEVLDMMRRHLEPLDLKVEIYISSC